MKIIALICLLTAACVDEPMQPPPDPPFPYANAYCEVDLDGPHDINGLGVGPCQLVITANVLCPPEHARLQRYNLIAVYWETQKPEYAFQIIETTYRCDEAVTIKFDQAVCLGQPFTAGASFVDPITPEISVGTHFCATAKVAL